jgi:hypothetical protein
MPLKGSLDETALGALDGRTKVWAVYAVGDQFHHGIHPRKGDELLRLYPNRATEIARVALVNIGLEVTHLPLFGIALEMTHPGSRT